MSFGKAKTILKPQEGYKPLEGQKPSVEDIRSRTNSLWPIIEEAALGFDNADEGRTWREKEMEFCRQEVTFTELPDIPEIK